MTPVRCSPGSSVRSSLALLAGILAGFISGATPAVDPAQEDAKPALQPGAPEAPGGSDPAPMERAAVDDEGDLFLEIRVTKSDTYASVAERYLSSPMLLPSVQAVNGLSMPKAGEWLRIPYCILSPDYLARVMHDLFPDDSPRGGDWVHRVGRGKIAAAEESLWNLALWYTGRGENFSVLADRNEIADLAPRGGQEIVIPGEILLPAFTVTAGGVLDDDFSTVEISPPPEEESRPSGRAVKVPSAEGADDLAYGEDREGRFAIYRLKRGEALFSSVVVRFTGRVDVQDVNDLAQRIAERSGIDDVTDIPVGFEIKIPLAELLPEYLPREDPQRLAWERKKADVASYTNRAESRDLEGVAVILDAGHGGRDRGAAHNGIWEHDYVYDVLCRIKDLLERKTKARVLTTIKDRKEGYKIQNKTRLRRSQAEVLLTDPPYHLRPGTMGVNLRWYLANAYFRRLVKEGFDPRKIVFTSLHADARHPSLRGAMVYVPGEQYRRGRYGNGSPVYGRYREVRDMPFIKFARADRERSEGLSRQFADTLLDSLRQRSARVHPHRPVRERIIRRRRSWVPAVLRCNAVPVKVLLEIANLSNRDDSRLLAKPSYRQKVALAYVDSLQRYFESRPEAGSAASKKGR